MTTQIEEQTYETINRKKDENREISFGKEETLGLDQTGMIHINDYAFTATKDSGFKE